MDIQSSNVVMYVYRLINGEIDVDKREYKKNIWMECRVQLGKLNWNRSNHRIFALLSRPVCSSASKTPSICFDLSLFKKNN